jgi:two-component system response regulator ResD
MASIPSEVAPDVKKVLVVDDDPAIHRLVSAIIQVIGDVEVESSYDGLDALERARKGPPDLIVSDVNMPGMDGLELTKAIRETPELGATPVLLLTARAESQDKYEGFLQGADDYLVKPFDATELQFRIKALLRRSPRAAAAAPAPGDGGVVTAGALAVDVRRYLARAAGQEIRLTASEMAILRHLVTNPDQVVSVEGLLTQALDYPPRLGNPQVIHTHMKNIRAKFRDVGVDPAFLNSSRQGYMLVAAE